MWLALKRSGIERLLSYLGGVLSHAVDQLTFAKKKKKKATLAPGVGVELDTICSVFALST